MPAEPPKTADTFDVVQTARTLIPYLNPNFARDAATGVGLFVPLCEPLPVDHESRVFCLEAS